MEQVRTFIEPIKKKWVYHFIISSKTNVLEKPEWYLNQTLKWIYEHMDVVESKVKLKPTEDGKCCNIRHKFILCMVELAMKRLTLDMSKISDNLEEDIHNEAILIHSYNEVVQFTKVIRQLLGKCYSNLSADHDLLSVFSHQKLFEKIIDVEWEHAERNLKNITSSQSRWEPVLDGDFVDNYKIPRCVDCFLMLIRSITERVECFLQLDCQFKLIELQCSLFNKFLSFLKRSSESSPVGLKTIPSILFFGDESTIDLTTILRIMNSVNFLRLILKDQTSDNDIKSCYIPNNVMDNLDATLLDNTRQLAKDYEVFFYKLVDRVAEIYEYLGCDLQEFLEFLRPKLSDHIFEIVKDKTRCLM